MILVFLACTGGKTAADVVAAHAASIIPMPTVVTAGDGAVEISADPTHFSVHVADAGAMPAEAYVLDVTAEGISILAGDDAGIFYALQTLRQLAGPETLVDTVELSEADVRALDGVLVPLVHVEDAPRFAYRGVMIDVARHFFTVAEVERQIELASFHKLNVVHLHLTDDQGWRFEVPSWPLLTEVGGASEVGGGAGGYYSTEEYAEIVAFAADRHVTVVPEIDFPGHSNAALSSYAELNESGVPAEPFTGTEMHSASLWLEGPDTARFVTDVWAAMAAQTPGNFLHMGADEAINTPTDQYGPFVQSLQAVAAYHGKTMVGWDEIGTVALSPPFLAQHWADAENAALAVDQGGRLIESPAEHAYLDMVYAYDADYGQIWAGPVNVERAYDWDPVPDGLVEANVAGVEGALWTEYIDDQEKMDFMVWPRLACLAEAGWSVEENRDWAEFSSRLAWHGRRLDALGVGYYRSDEIAWE